MSKKKWANMEPREVDPKERIRQKKLAKSLVDMENIKFSTQRQLKAVNEVLELIDPEVNKRVYERTMNLLKKLSSLDEKG